MQFSVLMSVYKNEKAEYLDLALHSMVGQTLKPNEIVVVEDGLLTEELSSCIDKYEKGYPGLFRRIAFKENRGLGLALRDGVLACRYDYIARMDTDDIAVPERFARQFAYLEKHQEVALLGTWIKEFSSNLVHPDTVTNLPVTHEEIIKYAKKRNPFRHMTAVYKKAAVIDSGNYQDFLWFEDYDLWVRMLQKGYVAANLPEYLVNVRAGDEMFARRGGWRYLKQEIRFQKYLQEIGFISFVDYISNVCIRSLMRLMPDWLRKVLYKNCLRKMVK